MFQDEIIAKLLVKNDFKTDINDEESTTLNFYDAFDRTENDDDNTEIQNFSNFKTNFENDVKPISEEKLVSKHRKSKKR